MEMNSRELTLLEMKTINTVCDAIIVVYRILQYIGGS